MVKSKRSDVKITTNDIILTARNLVDSSSQRVGALDWTLRNGKIVIVQHSVTGRDFGEIDLSNGKLLPTREQDRENLINVHNTIIQTAESDVVRRELNNLMNFPFRNKDKIDNIVSEYPELKPDRSFAPTISSRKRIRITPKTPRLKR